MIQSLGTSSRRAVLLAALTGTTACRRKRGDGFEGYAFVANQEGNAVAAVDLSALALARHIPLDDSPCSVVAWPDRPFVYALTPASGVLYEIDCGKLAVRRRLRLGGPATSMRMERGGRALWVLSAPGRRLLRISLEDLRVAHAMKLPTEPSDFDLSNDTGLAAIAYSGAASVSLVDLARGHVGRLLPMRGRVGTIRFRFDGEAVLVAGTAERLLTVLDVKSERVVVHLPLPLRPDHLCFHPNGGQVFVTGEGRDALVVAYVYFVPEIAETVLAGSRPGSMYATDSYLFVTNPGAGDVSIFNITKRRLIAVTAVGTGPGCVTVTPDGEYALVLNETSGDMAVIRIAGLQPDRRKSAALFTMIPVGSKPVSAVVMKV